MLGIAIWGSVKRRPFLARDPFGIKPLYYATIERGTAFGSKKKSLFEATPEIDIDVKKLDKRALKHYVDLQYVSEPESLYIDIVRLESDCTAIVMPGGEIKQTRYFKPNFPTWPVTKGVEQNAFDHITCALEDSVKKYIRVDVTVGLFPSGGIDSIAIATLAKRHNPNLLTFTTSFEREGLSGIDVAVESAATISIEHVIKIVSPEEFAGVIPKIMWYLDDPVVDPALVPLYFMAAEVCKYAKVVLSGKGVDELFGGYTIYKEPLPLEPPGKAPSPLLCGLAKIGEALLEDIRGKPLLQQGTAPLEQCYYGNARFPNFEQPQEVPPWAKKEWGHSDVTVPIYAQSESQDPVTQMQRSDLFIWLCGDILVKVGKIAMADLLELRVPLLDCVVFDVVQMLPVNMRVPRGTTKYALRRIMEQAVLKHVLDHRKLGFLAPVRHWPVGDELHGWAEDIIRESQTGELINKDAVFRMLAEYYPTEHGHLRRLRTILTFMVWYGIFVEDRITPGIEQRDYPVELQFTNSPYDGPHASALSCPGRLPPQLVRLKEKVRASLN